MNLAREEGDHSIDNPELKADEGERPIAGEKRGNLFHVTECRHGSHFCPHLFAEEFPAFRAVRLLLH